MRILTLGYINPIKHIVYNRVFISNFYLHISKAFENNELFFSETNDQM